MPHMLAGAFRAIGHFQARILLSVVYLLLIWPLGLLVRGRDPLRLKPGPAWVPRATPLPTLERFGHPF